MPTGLTVDRHVIGVAVERREQRRRGGAVEAGVVEEDLEDARQSVKIIPRRRDPHR